MAEGWIGRPLARREDVRFVTGRGTYLDDLPAEGALHLGFVRSPFAHARLGAIDASGALALDGVAAVLTAADLNGSWDPYPIAAAEGAEVAAVPLPILGSETVRFVGEPVAAILAESAALIEDAVELVTVDYDDLPPVADVEQALAGDVRVHEDLPDNVVARWERGGEGVEEAFAAAHTVVRQRFRIPRLVAAPIETRGALARYEPRNDLLTVWLSSQDPHRPLANLTKMLRRPPERTRVIVPDVGGAFGSKGPLAPEAAVAALLAIRTGRPVKWIERRGENFLAAYQGRGLDADVQFAADADGRVLAVRARLVADVGAYLQPTSIVPGVTSGMLMCGTYAIPAAHVQLEGIATNKGPVGPYRGAGRPEAAILVERMIDLLADELRIDPVEVRQRNFIPPDAFPYTTPLGFVYDSGEYAKLLRLARDLIGERSWTDDATRRHLRGVGFAMYVERAGGGAAAAGSLGESAEVSIQTDGRVLLRSGATAHGQGHETTFAQIVAEALGVHPDDVDVHEGDSQERSGVGTFGSRSVTIAGSAALLAARALRERAIRMAALLLEAGPQDVEWVAGRARLRGAPGREADLAALAAFAAEAPDLPLDLKDGLVAEAEFTLPGPVFPSGAYAAEVDIDPETGVVDVRRIVAVDDAGRVVNPMLAHGQIQGGVAQGIGQSLLEEVVHDEAAQPLATSFLQYAMPSAAEVPPVESATIETPSPFNPLGAKGIGEAGAIGTPAAIANAVCRALTPLGIRHLDLPFTPERVRSAIRDADR